MLFWQAVEVEHGLCVPSRHALPGGHGSFRFTDVAFRIKTTRPAKGIVGEFLFSGKDFFALIIRQI
jgi:hypothetical protein